VEKDAALIETATDESSADSPTVADPEATSNVPGTDLKMKFLTTNETLVLSVSRVQVPAVGKAMAGRLGH